VCSATSRDLGADPKGIGKENESSLSVERAAMIPRNHGKGISGRMNLRNVGEVELERTRIVTKKTRPRG